MLKFLLLCFDIIPCALQYRVVQASNTISNKPLSWIRKQKLPWQNKRLNVELLFVSFRVLNSVAAWSYFQTVVASHQVTRKSTFDHESVFTTQILFTYSLLKVYECICFACACTITWENWVLSPPLLSREEKCDRKLHTYISGWK